MEDEAGLIEWMNKQIRNDKKYSKKEIKGTWVDPNASENE